jgi:hypothetical protein
MYLMEGSLMEGFMMVGFVMEGFVMEGIANPLCKSHVPLVGTYQGTFGVGLNPEAPHDNVIFSPTLNVWSGVKDPEAAYSSNIFFLSS